MSAYFLLWLTSHCKSMSSEMIINKMLSPICSMLSFFSLIIVWPNFPSFLFIVWISMLSRNMPERKISLREKIWYQKICFQFSCDLYDARVWQTSSQSNIILFTICFVCQRIQIHTHLRSLFSSTQTKFILRRKKSAPMK